MKIHIKVVWGVMLLTAAWLSSGCYVTQDGNGQWWACEDYQAQAGIVSACTPIEPPF
jgi:hypothetical protein